MRLGSCWKLIDMDAAVYFNINRHPVDIGDLHEAKNQQFASALMSNVEIHPQTLFKRGIIKDLVRQVSAAHHRILQFQIQGDAKKKMKIKGRGGGSTSDTELLLLYFKEECTCSLSNLARRKKGFRHAIEYIQDFGAITGL